MCPEIKIPEDLYSRLQDRASGFDTPASVIEKLLDHVEIAEKVMTTKKSIRRRDTTKYEFKNDKYGKGRLVLNVVKDYFDRHENVTFEKLVDEFPKHLQGSIGVINKLNDVERKYEGKSQKRHFMKDVIKLKDFDVVVCTEWGVDNIKAFISWAKSKKYTITEIKY